MGNLSSVRRALEELGAEPFVADHPHSLVNANRVVLPGVGAFSEGMARLKIGGWAEAIERLVRVERKPLLGICLGMQMLARAGDEGGDLPGLSLIEGRVRRLDSLGCTLRVPHVGWNDVACDAEDPLFARIPQSSDFYFVHSYAIDSNHCGQVIGSTHYGTKLVAAIRVGNVMGTQFHPEKSSKVGRQLLKNFLEFSTC